WDVAELDRLKRNGRAPASAWDGVIRLARDLSAAGTIAVADGEVAAAALTAWDAVAPREVLALDRRAGAGQAIPAAIAAKLARPDRQVVAFTDPDGVAAGIPELTTAARHRAPITVVVLGAGAWRERLASMLRPLDVTVAVVDDEAAFAPAFTRAAAAGAPTVVGV